MPVATSVALTLAFGTTAPLGSVTEPLIAPRKVWAGAATAMPKNTSSAKSERFMVQPPWPGVDKKTPAARGGRLGRFQNQRSPNTGFWGSKRTCAATAGNSILEVEESAPHCTPITCLFCTTQSAQEIPELHYGATQYGSSPLSVKEDWYLF